MIKVLFLDRDGVINRERGEHTWRMEDFEILPGAIAAIKEVHDRGRMIVVITNQSGIGLGLYGHADVERLHGYLHEQMDKAGIRSLNILYCPHHPSKGKCLCRKPGGLLFEKAIARLGLDTEGAVMIGDRERDMEAAASVGVQGVLVEANTDLREALQKVGLLR